MIITTWIVYLLSRKGAGFPFPPKTSSVSEVGSSHVELFLMYLLSFEPLAEILEEDLTIYNYG